MGLRALVIVPTYNERENLQRLAHEVLATDPTLDILVVDDDSPDGTGEVADLLAARQPRVAVLHRTGRQGLGTAYLAGFRHALLHDYDFIVEMDADFSHRPEDLPALLKAAASADLVIGSRNVAGGRTEHWSPLRHLISRGGSLYTRLLLDLPIRDCTSGFKVFRRALLANLELDRVRSSGFGFQVELNYLCHHAGARIVEVPIVFPDRRAGRSKMSRRIFLEAIRLVWQLRSKQVAAPVDGAGMQPVSGRGTS